MNVKAKMASGRILVVDSDEDNRDLSCQVLRRQGYCVEEATSGERALDNIRSARPDLVITSTLTRDIAGLVLVRRIRAIVDASVLPIVMYTPISSEAKLEALEAGVNDFLTRPFHQTELVARARALLSFRQAHRDIAELKRILTEITKRPTDSRTLRPFANHSSERKTKSAQGMVRHLQRN